ncbi:MAG: hypothetical protein GF350_08815 [Chitinivibrionales bacterium]|nr:hypothetical protein [Chitinivibrionales bacterium]
MCNSMIRMSMAVALLLSCAIFQCENGIEPNTSPVIEDISAEDSVMVYHTVTIDLNAADADGDPVTFAVAQGPLAAQINGAQLVWRPVLADTGTQTIVVTASDGPAADSATIQQFVWYPVDTCKRVALLHPSERRTCHIGDTIELIWSLAPQGTDGGLDIAVSPDNGKTFFFPSGEGPLEDNDPSVYQGAIGFFRWVIPDSVTDGYLTMSTVSDSLLIGVQDNYSVDECEMKNPPTTFWVPMLAVQE